MVKKVQANQKKTNKKKVAIKKKVIKGTKIKTVQKSKKSINKKQPTPKIKVDKPKVVKKISKTTKAQKKDKPLIVGVPIRYQAYTLDQYNKYKEILEEWKNKSNEQIKQQLAINFQTKSGTKDEILTKLADGMVLGQIPRCPNCFGGRPQFNQQTGSYYCPGYRDDTTFRNCHKRYQLEELKRQEWITNSS